MDIIKALGDFFSGIIDSISRTADEMADTVPEEAELSESEQTDEELIERMPTSTVRATIKSARREMDPVTLQGWSRVIFNCDDGVERKMFFPGDNGVFLVAGESGILEHREGSFVSFEKDSGEIVGAMYHIMPEED